ncbi:blast:Protein kinase C-like 3 [Drosophila guanche]|uniref:Blast:Protein kinase C-like 3 n=1 Tax=Drosophila guanche TaxID=7266 RepID=A0A3B0IY92_DROGU|nr:blast:Protein kinase C-like 3 [Drosophila guanche]
MREAVLALLLFFVNTQALERSLVLESAPRQSSESKIKAFWISTSKDQIDDYICSFEGLGDLTMDSLAIFIFLWAVLALFSVWLCKLLYHKYLNKEKPTSAANSRQSSVVPGAAAVVSSSKPEKRLSEPRDMLATKSKVEDLSKPLTGGSAGRGRSSASPLSGGAAGAAGPRRRVVRQSSTGPENRKKRYVPPPSNVVGPETSSVTWTSQVFRWLYSDLVIVNELLMSWVIAINDSLRKSVEEHGVAVEVVRVLPDSPAPGLNNIFCNCDENNPADMLITFDCDATPVLQVKTFRQKSGKVETSHYKVTVSRFRARMAIPMNYNTLKGEMRVEGYPDVRIAMNSVGAIKAMDQDEQQLQTVISDILTTALRDTVYPVDFSIYSTCPRAEVEPLDLPHNMEHHLGGVGLRDSQHMVSGRRLLVKIVKGEGLRDAHDPYVVIEMDEPAQKNQTGTQRGSRPYWDEHFLFELSPQSAEILFEVYDHPVIASDPPKFLGLGLVGIDELAVGPASTQLLQLQPRPYETQPVAGAITVDFVFIEGAEIPAGARPQRLKEALRLSTPAINEHIRNGADLADAAVRALQDGALSATGSGGQPSKSTLIIHSVQRNSSNPNAFKFGQPNAASSPNGSGYHNNYNLNGSSGLAGNGNGSSNLNGGGYSSNSLPRNGAHLGLQTGEGMDVLDDRGRSKKRNFFGTLKKRLSRSKTRTLSADQPNSNHKSLSATNSNYANTTTTSTGLPRTATGTLNGDSSRSLSVDRATLSKSNSLESSAISGFSSASNKTYVHEASTLVLETIENGVKRHFIVPLAIAQRPRWRRKGTKLHIYNDHTFIAKHLSGSGLQCSICMKSIPRRPGKQGYECRDCQLICHKQCHVRAPQACPNPTVLSMELSSYPDGH